MAKYDREFLVPYLENLCALHLAEIKLNKYVNSTQNRVNSLLKGHNYAEPSRPIYDPTIDPGAFKVFKISLIIIVVSFLIALASGEGILSFLLVFVCAISIIVFVGSIFVLISGAIGILKILIMIKTATTEKQWKYITQPKYKIGRTTKRAWFY